MTKLLVTDFDYTLLYKNDYPKNIEKINKFVEKGNIFAIATGRHINKLLDDIKPYNIKYSYLICNDGGIIFDSKLNVIYRKDIPSKVVEPIINLYQSSPYVSDWYIDTGLFITKKIDNIANGLIGRITDTKKTKELLNNITNKYKEVHGYISEEHINITEKTVTKRKAIELISQKHNINQKDIYTIGDNINDISMSIYNSYCMDHSARELKKICKGEYDAVYKFIDDILNEKI